MWLEERNNKAKDFFPVLEDYPLRNPRILLVDDDSDHLVLFSMFLEKEGYEVVCAESAEEALALLRDHTVDIVVSDVLMPEMNGIEFLRLLRNSAKYSEIPVIFLTASEWQTESLVYQEEGPDMFCLKSLARSLLPSQIRFLL
ncbi:MAG: response regulator [SAR324 cluster bacterium]|uniref:Response regulator n=1 Tax=SAR324 cluster bacterium TaxID=2024889 RepID=A0A7X9FTH7_9DELT|nr:response regulator [SAR324 cluster bacterium]